MASFNLIDEPFVFAHNSDGTGREMSLTEVFQNAKSISRIGGDTAIQEFVLIRLLLAILYRAITPNDRAEWKELWREGLPIDRITAYLETHRERFDILHPKTPFYQIVGAEYDGKKQSSNLNLMLEMQSVGSTGVLEKFLFSSATNEGAKLMSFAQATRRLIEIQAYNVASRRAIIKGDTRTKKRRYAQMGWAGNLTGLVVQGNNLEQTLLLNLVPYDALDLNAADDLPVWEREQQTPAPEGLYGDMDESRTPYGPSDLYTNQVARITLTNNGSSVTGAVVGIGDRLFRYDKHTIEPMASWRRIKRENGSEVWTPVKVGTSQVWKSVDAILAQNASVKLGQKPAANLSWFDTVSRTIGAELGTTARVLTFEVNYGSQEAVIESFVTSQFSLPRDILHSTPILDAVVSAVTCAREVARAITALNADILVSEGKERKPVKGVSALELAAYNGEEFLIVMGQQFKLWVSTVDADNYSTKLREWKDIVGRFASAVGDDVASTASTRSIAGIMEGTKPMNLFIATSRFTRKMDELLSKKDKVAE